MSEALKRLASLGYVRREGGTSAVALSAFGEEAMRATSVLEPARLEAALARLSPADRVLVCRGLRKLARACRAQRT